MPKVTIGMTQRVAENHLIEIMNPGGVNSGDQHFKAGEGLMILSGGIMEAIAIREDEVLVKYSLPKGKEASATNAPNGTLFFIHERVFRRSTENYNKRQSRLYNQKRWVEDHVRNP